MINLPRGIAKWYCLLSVEFDSSCRNLSQTTLNCVSHRRTVSQVKNGENPYILLLFWPSPQKFEQKNLTNSKCYENNNSNWESFRNKNHPKLISAHHITIFTNISNASIFPILTWTFKFPFKFPMENNTPKISSLFKSKNFPNLLAVHQLKPLKC